MTYYTILFKHPITNYSEMDAEPVNTFADAMVKAQEKIESFMLSAAGKLVIDSEKIDVASETFEITFAFAGGGSTGACVSIKKLEYSTGSNAIGHSAIGLVGL